MNLIYGYCCEQGDGRRKVQDAMFFKADKVLKNTVYVAAVCDGVGKFPDSEFASSIVISFISEWFEHVVKIYADSEKHKSNNIIKTIYKELKNTLLDKLWTAHKFISAETRERKFNAGTTLCIILGLRNLYCIYNTGDSRAYEIGKKMKQITEDQIISYNGKNMLSNCLGCFPGPDFAITEGKIKKNKTYLLATDGFYRKLDKKVITNGFAKTKTSEDMENSIKTLRQYSLNAGEKDDSTGIALKFI